MYFFYRGVIILTSKIYKEDIGIAKNFINECMSIMKDIEREILQLETNSRDMGLYRQLNKDIDKIRRGSSFLGLPVLVRISFEMKFILDKATGGTVITEHIDNLLSAFDFLHSYINRLSQSLQEFSISEKKDDKYFEFMTNPDEEQILNSFKSIHKKYESEGNKSGPETVEVDSLYDARPAENLQVKMADDVKEQFTFEVAEHLEIIENDMLIRLDNDKRDREAINEIFRAVHSIKGGAGIYLSTMTDKDPFYEDTKNFLEVVHDFENLLSLIRDKHNDFDKDMVNLSFKVIDYLKSYIRFVSMGEGKIENYEKIIENINSEISSIQSLPTKSGQADVTVNQKADLKSENINLKGSLTQSIRVRQDKIDTMMNMISELVIAKNSFAHISEKLNMEYNLPEVSREIKQVEAYVNRISDELQNSIMSIRMVDIKTIFQKMPRVVRDIAQNTGKAIELVIEGEDTEIDKSVIEHISDPLVHIIRNCADHGIETYEERINRGKPGKGKIFLRAYNKNKYVFIEVEDDGRGINPYLIKEKAIEKGIITEAEAGKMSNNQLINLIFLPGFSTANKVTEVSGRGVGMDIVKSNISKINGSVTVESEIGKGTKMIIKLPLSLAISHGLIVEAESSDYIIPLESIAETVKIERRNIHRFNDKYFTYLRGTVIGIEWLSKIFLMGDRTLDKDVLNAVILINGAENFAIVVDRLKNEQEFVMKPLEGHLASIPGISGSTILGNGKVVLIVNPSDLIKLAGL